MTNQDIEKIVNDVCNNISKKNFDNLMNSLNLIAQETNETDTSKYASMVLRLVEYINKTIEEVVSQSIIEYNNKL